MVWTKARLGSLRIDNDYGYKTSLIQIFPKLIRTNAHLPLCRSGVIVTYMLTIGELEMMFKR